MKNEDLGGKNQKRKEENFIQKGGKGPQKFIFLGYKLKNMFVVWGFQTPLPSRKMQSKWGKKHKMHLFEVINSNIFFGRGPQLYPSGKKRNLNVGGDRNAQYIPLPFLL